MNLLILILSLPVLIFVCNGENVRLELLEKNEQLYKEDQHIKMVDTSIDPKSGRIHIVDSLASSVD